MWNSLNVEQPYNFRVHKSDGSVVIAVVGNQQNYRLQGVNLAQLTFGNFNALDTNALSNNLSTWQLFLDQAVEAPQEPEAPLELTPGLNDASGSSTR